MHALVARGALEHRHALAREHEPGRAVRVDGDAPGLCGFVGVGRADHAQLRHRPHGGQLLDGLVGRSVLTEPDGVVGPVVDDVRLAQGGQAHGRTHVVAEAEEGAAEGEDAAVQRHSVEDGAHAVLADAEVEQTAAGVVVRLDAVVLEVGARVPGEVGAPA